jgi:curli biogenesis system outer membrane secretion channel CsgG
MKRTLFILIILLLIPSCSPSIDQNQVKASLDIPVAAQVDSLNIPYNPNMETVYVTVEPVAVNIPSHQIVVDQNVRGDFNNVPHTTQANEQIQFYNTHFAKRQVQITTQLVSSLNSVKNFKVLDYDITRRNNFRLPEGASNNAQGPYLVRAVISEYDRIITTDEKTTRIAIAKRKQYLAKGIIGLDVSLVNPATGEVLDSFPVKGSYGETSDKRGASLLLTSSSAQTTAGSSADQALRVAFNNAAENIYKRFSRNIR